MTEGFANNATAKYLGYVYQVLIAIEKCFDAKPNETIWIECFGDVYDGKRFTEVKHHVKEHNLASNSADFWNTLKNLVEEDSSMFEQIVLHTTSFISERSIFHGWNTRSAHEKLSIIKSHVPSPSIKPLYDKIFKGASNAELLSILSRFTIDQSREHVEEKWKSLLGDRKLKCVLEPYRETILHWIYSYVNKNAIVDHQHWKVNINDFDDAFQFQVNRWSGENIPFPVDRTEYVTEQHAYSYLFLLEYKDIGLRGRDRGVALNDYFKTKNSEESLVDLKPDIMPEIIDNYLVDAVEKAKGYKRRYSYEIDYEDLGTSKSNKVAREAYFEFHNSSVLELPEVSGTKPYFMRGKVHEAINNTSYTWKYNEEDVD
ncbi:hypothetical protein AT00_09380 [Pseudoalteromonas lipolytica SCSIO 04301]|uniref:hypothetical protein n=1 Tax=Pseudoalteromonas lipolytica TaxID=570156 RepID=UPI000450A333|nr:hypothetical protein [Pseudoalteromonas lipolytica]EWH06197.1 hypothetical protein AT00_09380 [Pseudoalteromonas lipolytica SCSIO 04301]